MPKNKKNRRAVWIALLVIFVLGLIFISLPPIRERLAFHFDMELGRIYYTLFPPEKAVFAPITVTPGAVEASPTLEPSLTATLTPYPTDVDTPTPTITPTPLPSAVALKPPHFISQDEWGGGNFCSPANLAMELMYWKWEGDLTTMSNFLKPFREDFNVSPYEMVDYVNSETQLKAISRPGGTLELLKGLLAAGFPPVVEKGVFAHDYLGGISWMGHYNIVTGYDDAKQEFTTQDSLEGANRIVSYEDMDTSWRPFNYTFVVAYPPEQEGRLFALLGRLADEQTANQVAYERASEETYTTQGMAQFFAWFNRGTSMVALQDYFGASQAYDQAFLQIYPGLPEKERPYRIVWYQTGPYYAYFYSGRYQDVINLANNTLDAARKPYFEESYYWRAQAYFALGNRDAAVKDVCSSLKYHAGFEPSLTLMEQQGVSTCP